MSWRLTPFAFAIVSAAFTLGIQPTGLIAVAALIAGGRPILRILVRCRAIVGTWPLVALLLAAGTVILTVVFADQTLATVLEATRIRTDIGPSQEGTPRTCGTTTLILPTVDGSLSRRFGFLITALSLFISMFIMLRHKGSRRGPTGLAVDGRHLATMFFLMFTPTKWVHHFRAVHAVGAAMAALATVLASPAVLRWSRKPDDRGDRGFVPVRAVRARRRTAGGTSRATACCSTMRCRASVESPSARSSCVVRGVGAVHGV